ncbi:MAG: ABC-2 family transporter protein [Verrucomicrobia bacterium]|nr:ABC-2 family transporter protein [Verrucomicrobiota bacterium]
MKTFSFFLSLVSTSIRASISIRGAFLIEFVLMVANNLIFFSLWWIFFQNFVDVGGWKIDDIAASMAILSGSYGISQICFGGIKNLGAIILNGDLDPFMVQPKNLLLHLAASKSRSKGWGHLMTTVVLLIFIGTWKSVPLVVLVSLSGSMIFISMYVIVSSLTFWYGTLESVTHRFLDSLFVFSLYPTNIYSGILQIVMFTVIPAGLIGYLPVELLREFTWTRLGIILGSSAAFTAFAYFIFYRGLKRYESGNQFGMRL